MLNRSWTCVFTLLSLLPASLTAASADIVNGRHVPRLHSVRPVAPSPLLMRGRARAPFAFGPTYALTNFGSPSTSDPADFAAASYGDGPVAFNNTGQILGSATGTRYVGNAHPPECVLWTGYKFVNVDTAKSALSSCSASALSDENPSTKVVSVAGSAGYLTEQTVAYSASVSVPRGLVSPLVVYGSSPSKFVGFGPNGAPVGQEYYAPLHQDSFTSTATVPAIYKGGQLTLLQPGCDGRGARGCLSSVQSVSAGGMLGACQNAYPSCLLAKGQTKALPVGYGEGECYMSEYSYSSVNVNADVLGVLTNYGPNGSGCVDTVQSTSAMLFISSSGSPQSLTPAGCAGSYAYSFNDSDEVLGSAYGCSGPEPAFNWTWTAAGGFQDLTAAFTAPANGGSVIPLQLNNTGAILVSIVGYGILDWGVLTPVTGSSRRAAAGSTHPKKQ